MKVFKFLGIHPNYIFTYGSNVEFLRVNFERFSFSFSTVTWDESSLWLIRNEKHVESQLSLGEFAHFGLSWPSEFSENKIVKPFSLSFIIASEM